MEVLAFATLVIPFILVVYLGVLLFIRPPRQVLIASLLGGLSMAIINMVFDELAYYASWWHYTLNGLILHLPLPFYITPLLVYGSIAYLLIGRFWSRRGHWFALLLLIGIPLFRAATDIIGALLHTGYTQFDSILAGPLTLVMWLLMFYTGFWLFCRLAHFEVRLRRQVS